MNNPNTDFLDLINKKTMQSSVMDYSLCNTLSLPEVAALKSCVDKVRGRSILDLGVGAGRTVEPLNQISSDYIGIDYVEEMVIACRERYPNVRFQHADARSLTDFGDNSFALIVFGCNGICMVDHSGRLAILKEVYRLLLPGGFFLFSTYNRNNTLCKKLFQFPDLRFTINPVKLFVRVSRFVLNTLVRLFNRIRFKALEQEHQEYAIVNKVCHNYATMLYYISPNSQQKQLNDVGFSSGVTMYDLEGNEVAGDPEDDSLTWLVVKPV
jgi:SAM-dependent methyltransferase